MKLRDALKKAVQMRPFWKIVAVLLAAGGVYVSPELVDGVAVIADAVIE